MKKLLLKTLYITSFIACITNIQANSIQPNIKTLEAWWGDLDRWENVSYKYKKDCVGKPSCKITGVNRDNLGDPYPYRIKRLYVKGTCSSGDKKPMLYWWKLRELRFLPALFIAEDLNGEFICHPYVKP